MKYSSFALAAIAVAASTVNGFGAPKFAVRQVRMMGAVEADTISIDNGS
jgi:hypothetical protein